MKTIGFIGTGVMGASMASHLMTKGYSVHIYNRTKEKAKNLLENGAIWHDSVQELSKKCDCIITMVGYPSDVEEVYFSDKGILANAKPGTIVIDMTTSSPKVAKKIFVEAQKIGLKALDAPVSGGDIGAKNATLTIMVGGDLETYNEALEIFTVLGKTIRYQGPVGSGQYTKMTNQIAIAGSLLGTCEAMTMAKEAGLNPTMVLESISGGAASSWQLINLGQKMIQNDFNPGFYIKHFVKDLGIALEACKELQIRLPLIELALKFYTNMGKDEYYELGTQALYKYYQENIYSGFKQI